MPKKCQDLADSVTISVAPYTGKYTTNNSPGDDTYSYYLNGKTTASNVHFTVGPTGRGKSDFTTFHITIDINGSNGAIWYDRGTFKSVNTKNLPPAKLLLFDAQWKGHEQEFNSMARQFWTALNK
jgi:hypothetical protein